MYEYFFTLTVYRTMLTTLTNVVRMKHLSQSQTTINVIDGEKKCGHTYAEYFIDETREYRLARFTEFLFPLLRNHPRRHTHSHKSTILRHEINWNNAECVRSGRSLRPERSEEFVNDRKATRSYLRTHMRSLSAPVNNLPIYDAACVNRNTRILYYVLPLNSFEDRRIVMCDVTFKMYDIKILPFDDFPNKDKSF